MNHKLVLLLITYSLSTVPLLHIEFSSESTSVSLSSVGGFIVTAAIFQQVKEQIVSSFK